MIHTKTRLAAILVAATTFILSASNAAAQTDPVQVLDRVTVTGQDFALDMKANDPDRDDDFSILLGGSKLPNGTNLVDCTTSVSDGLFCIDKKEVFNWSNINNATALPVFKCTDSALGLDKKKSNPCTALTRNLQKVMFLGGKRNGKSNVVTRIVANPNPGFACVAPYDNFADTDDFCFAPLADGRPLIQDLDVIEGDLADEFAGEEVLLVLEERKTLLTYSNIDPDVGPTVTEVIANGKKDWNLASKEQILNATLLPYDGNFYGVVSTTKGRILAINMEGASSGYEGFEVFDIADNRGSFGECPLGNNSFDVTVSDKTGAIYVTDGLYCLVHVLKTVPDNVNLNPFALEIAQELDPDTMLMTNLTLSTNDMGGQGTFPPMLVHVAPGISVDLSLCGDPMVGCTPVTAKSGKPGLTMRGVGLGASAETEMTLFQITGYPDCRWNPLACALLLDPMFSGDDDDAVLFLRTFFDPFNPGKLPNVIVDLDPNLPNSPEFQLLNLEPLLPAEIKALFPEGLEPLLMEREVRALAKNDYLFDAFFGVSPDGLFFERSYELEIDAEELLADSGTGLGMPAALGCVLGLQQGTPLYADMDNPFGTLDWDVMTKVSEKFITITSNSPPATSTGNRRPYAPAGVDNFETRIINSGCINPARGRDGGWSMVSYGLEITPCTAMRNEDDDGWILGGVCDVGDPPAQTGNADDAVLAKLLLKEYKDFRDALNELACIANESIDGPGAMAPVDSNACDTIDDVWVNGLDKLVKGLEATLFPKTSQGNENLGAFEAKLAQLRNLVENYMPPTPSMRPDLANRKGELEARLLTIEHIYEERFKPSITDDGFGDTGWVH